jgi:hypothetical protein
LSVEQKTKDGSTKTGRLNLVDLAGSEKVGKTGATGQTLEEVFFKFTLNFMRFIHHSYYRLRKSISLSLRWEIAFTHSQIPRRTNTCPIVTPN